MKKLLAFGVILLSPTNIVCMEQPPSYNGSNKSDDSTIDQATLREIEQYHKKMKINNPETLKREFNLLTDSEKVYSILGASNNGHNDTVAIMFECLNKQSKKEIASKLLNLAINNLDDSKAGTKVVAMLANNGFNLNDFTEAGISFLLVACSKAEETGKTNALEAMLMHGANPRAINILDASEQISTFDFMNELNKNGWGFLHIQKVLDLLGKAMAKKQ